MLLLTLRGGHGRMSDAAAASPTLTPLEMLCGSIACLPACLKDKLLDYIRLRYILRMSISDSWAFTVVANPSSLRSLALPCLATGTCHFCLNTGLISCPASGYELESPHWTSLLMLALRAYTVACYPTDWKDPIFHFHPAVCCWHDAHSSFSSLSTWLQMGTESGCWV